ncbi:unnamed protein product [Spodoptera littoralis]|uniref:TIL domain-containing protein n=1 Tax=Spodoptera littoralis TaxID=7109 RepID=A0A9P0N7D0_SPOLI|nr:unnamed protein product [Spodoptera littoralis]CAH1644194.1 unnamed protein product [Spodoptera littoralis]
MGRILKKKTVFKLFHLIVATVVLVCHVHCIDENEEKLSECMNFLCTPQYCSQLGFSIDCPRREDPDQIKDKCQAVLEFVCKDGYVRDDTGKCIPMGNCPSCGGDPNAVSSCGRHCDPTCSDLKGNRGRKGGCLPICILNSCSCRKGFIFDSNVALHKSEAVCFMAARRGIAPPPSKSQITAGGVTIGVETANFVEHFRRLAPKLERTGTKRLLPEVIRRGCAVLGPLRRPSEDAEPDAAARSGAADVTEGHGDPNDPRRTAENGLPGLRLEDGTKRLLPEVIRRGRAVLGPVRRPVRTPNLMRRAARALPTSQRVMVIRMIHGYHTISGEAANLLVGLPPWDLEAKVFARVYLLRAEARRWGETSLPCQICA